MEESGLGINNVEESSSSNVGTNNDLKVRVRRQDSTTHTNVSMNEEFKQFVRTYFPNFQSECLTFPESFQYDKDPLKSVQGFPYLANYISNNETNFKNWKINVGGSEGEEMLYNHFGKMFKRHNKPGLLIHGLEIANLFKVAKESSKDEVEEKRKQNSRVLDVRLTKGEIKLAKICGIDSTKINTNVDKILDKCIQQQTNSSFEWFRSFRKLIFFNRQISQKSIENALRNVDDDLNTVSKNDETNFKNLKLEKVMLEKLRYKMEKAKKDDVTKREASQFLVRFKLVQDLNQNQEFDFIAVDKATSTLYHIETKAYPLKNNITEKGLQKTYKDACKQLEIGKNWFHKILVPATKLSKQWKRVGLVCLPNMENRDTIKGKLKNNINDTDLKYILTKKEIKGENDWQKQLNIDASRANKEEYERLVATLIGSLHVRFECQTFDYSENARKDTERILGKPINEVVGVGGGAFDDDIPSEMSFESLKGRGLGSVHNIIFWNRDQRNLWRKFLDGESFVVCGDFGTGKTSILVAAALHAVKQDPTAKVVFYVTKSLSWRYDEKEMEPILAIALKEKIEKAGIKVISGLSKYRSISIYIIKHLQEHCKGLNVKLFVDEFPLDKRFNKRETAMAVRAMKQHSRQIIVALNVDIYINFPSGNCSDFVTEFSEASGLNTNMLRNCVRNCGNISDQPDILTRKKDFWPKSSKSTVPGEKSNLILKVSNTLTHKHFLIKSLKKTLKEIFHLDPRRPITEHIVILSDLEFFMEDVTKYLDKIGFSFSQYNCFTDSDEFEEQKRNVIEWLQSNTRKILVTQPELFKGMEAPSVIYITDGLSLTTFDLIKSQIQKSNLMRAVTKLAIICTGDKNESESRVNKFREKYIIHEI